MELVINPTEGMLKAAKRLGLSVKPKFVYVEVVGEVKVTETLVVPKYRVGRKRTYVTTSTKRQVWSRLGGGDFNVLTSNRLKYEQQQKRVTPHVERKL